MATPFKMKSSPTKGKLGDFFKGLSKEGTEKRKTKQVQENQGMTNFEKSQAEKATQRKTGKSKFQRSAEDRKKRKSDTAAGDARNAADKKTFEAKKSADNSYGVKKSDANKKPDHNKNLKGLTGVERRKYYDQNKLKYDKTIKFFSI